MKVDAALLDFFDAGAAARRLETLGYDGVFTFEGPHDPFFPLVAAARETERIELQTAIAVAFARNPMTLAYLGWDLNQLSAGRFQLGLGTQIRAHVEKRFGMPWSRPAARMREMIRAIRAIWRCWQDGKPLDFRGEFYRHTLMTPFFTPEKNPHGGPPIWLAGVGPRMTEVAGEVADGFLVHPFHSTESLRALTLPALERGRARATPRRDFTVACQVMIATGPTAEATERARATTRQQIAFYASTPAYRVVLDVHGWGGLQPELNALSKRGEWARMGERISDELLETVAIAAPWPELADRVRDRCGGFASRVSLVAPWSHDPDAWAPIVRALRG